MRSVLGSRADRHAPRAIFFGVLRPRSAMAIIEARCPEVVALLQFRRNGRHAD